MANMADSNVGWAVSIVRSSVADLAEWTERGDLSDVEKEHAERQLARQRDS